MYFFRKDFAENDPKVNLNWSEQQFKNKLSQLEKTLTGLEFQKNEKDQNKTVSLGTSKINYMDPRITVKFCKQVKDHFYFLFFFCKQVSK